MYLVIKFELFLFPLVSVSALHEVISRPADGGITALHMAALNGHAETVHLLLDIGASASEVTVEDGTTIDLIGMLIFDPFLCTIQFLIWSNC